MPEMLSLTTEREGCAMNERGLWELFCRTGLPAAWLAMSGQRQEEEAQREETVRTAFQPRVEKV